MTAAAPLGAASDAHAVGRIDRAGTTARVVWGTETVDGRTCFTGLRTRREAKRLARL